MMSEQEGSYESRLSKLLDSYKHVADLLAEGGMDAAWVEVITVAAEYHLQENEVLFNAAEILLQSNDEEKQQKAYEFIRLWAVTSPSLSVADSLSQSAEFDVRQGGPRARIEAKLNLSFLHYKSIPMKDDIAFNTDLLSHVGLLLERARRLNFYEKYEEYLQQISTRAFMIANDLEDKQWKDEYDRNITDTMLMQIAETFARKDPDKSRAALKLIRNGPQKEYVENAINERELIEALDADDWLQVELVLGDSRTQRLDRVWECIESHMERGTRNHDWIHAVFDIMHTAKPDYFSRYAMKGSLLDARFGEVPGTIIGRIDRRDAMEQLLVPQENNQTGIRTARGIARGLGLQRNDDGFAFLQTRITHFKEETLREIEAIFNDAKRYARYRHDHAERDDTDV